MRIAIVDDLEEDREELQTMLEQYCEKQGFLTQYDIYTSAEELLADFTPQKFDILFLDIYMTGMTGMEAAKKISQMDSVCRMIFFTTSHAHAVESYEVRATYYLTKPLDYSRIRSAMDTACANLQHDNLSIALHCAGISCNLLLRNILFVDCVAEHTRLHFSQSSMTVDERISNVLTKLSEDVRFLNCNRNVIVNMDQILKTEECSFLLKNGEAVPIRQRDCSTVKREFLQYSLRALRKETSI